MLRIRFQRVGRKNSPAYRVVVAEKTRAVKGKFLEILGSYDPVSKKHTLVTERVQHWINSGAQPSDSVARFLKAQGITGVDKYINWVTFTKKAAEETAAA